MQDRFETDVMDDLFYEAAEGPARMADELLEFDEFEEDGFEEFEEDAFEEFDEDEFAGDYASDEDAMDALEEAVADALAADDADEFFRRLWRGVRRVGRTVGRVARRVGGVVGRIARTVAPIASAIPLPWTQAIGRVAGIAGRLMADEMDEFDAFDELADLADDEEALDAAAPVIAGLTIRRTVPGVSRLPRPVRRQLVRSVTQATRTLARRQGAEGARAVPAVVGRATRVVVRRGAPARVLPQAVARTTARVARRPRVVRRLAQAAPRAALPGAPAATTIRRRGGALGRGRTLQLRGPVRITIHSR